MAGHRGERSFPWLLLSLVLAAGVAVGLYAWGASVSGVGQQVLYSIASAIVSIVGAILISEIILKKIYRDDLIEKMNLNSRLVQLGLLDSVEVSRSTWERIYERSGDYTICVSDPELFWVSHWPTLRSRIKAGRCAVKIFFPLDCPVNQHIANKISGAWAQLPPHPNSTIEIGDATLAAGIVALTPTCAVWSSDSIDATSSVIQISDNGPRLEMNKLIAEELDRIIKYGDCRPGLLWKSPARAKVDD